MSSVSINEDTVSREECQNQMADLKKQVRDVPPQDYTVAKRFLESLAYEARLPAS